MELATVRKRAIELLHNGVITGYIRKLQKAHRQRHEMWAMVAAKLATFDQGRPMKKAPIGTIKINEAAQSLNVGERTVQRAKKVLDNGAPEVQEAVERGEVFVRPAAARQRLHRRREGATGFRAVKML